jgi:hypothetical protein
LSSVLPPPIFDNLTDDSGDKANLSWILFFNQLFEGDTGTNWLPTFQSLTVAVAPTITGRYYRIGRRLCFFRVTLAPPADTTSVAGTTYISNFPLTFTNDGICFAVSGNIGSNSGQIVASNNRIYVPTWTAVTVPITIVGFGEVRP